MRTIGDLVRRGVWLGLVYGLLEGAAFTVLSFIPGALSWRTANSFYALWFAPLTYAVAFGALGALLGLLALAVKRAPWDRILVGLCVALGAYLMLRLPNLLWPSACFILALGIGVRGAALYGKHHARAAPWMTRTLPRLGALVALLALACIGGSRARERLALSALRDGAAGRPNVLILLIDTQRADHLSSYGYRRPTSPRVDRLAGEGALFERAYSHSSWTLPSHATLFTAQPLHEHQAGLVRRPYLDGHFPTLAEVMRREGYATGAFVANTFWVGRQTGLARGFIRFEDFYGSLGDALVRTVLGRLLTYEVLPVVIPLDLPGRKSAAHVNRDLLGWVDGLDGRPFFAFVNYFDVHMPYTPPAATAGTFGWTPPRRSGRIDVGALDQLKGVPGPDEMARLVAGYDESVLYVDAQIGALTDALRARGLLDNTVVIITSDHGESWGEHNVMLHGHSLWYDQVRVPLIIRYPRAVPAGTRVAHPVGNAQVAATVMAVTGVRTSPFAGRSLLAAMTADDPARDTVLVEVGRRSIAGAHWPVAHGWVAGLLADRWQYLHEQTGKVELFDVLADPRETTNLASAPGSSPVLAAFDARLRAEPVRKLGFLPRLFGR
ncbi:MAG: sulfatase [Gemmatimonadaceae bacterium]